jgi:hypothetical protein
MLRNFAQLRAWLGIALLVFAGQGALADNFCVNNNPQPNPDPISVVKYTLDSKVTNQTIVNECNGENVIMNGIMHFEYFFLTDADADFIIYHISSTSHLTGVGQTTGARYVANDSTSTTDRTRDLASNQTMTLKSRLVAQGPTPDMLIRQLLHVVVNRSGNIKADVVKNTVTCR